MTLLLDTNAFIWAMANVEKFGRRAKQDIANSANLVYVSDLSMLECAIKQRTGKLRQAIIFEDIAQALEAADIRQLSFDAWAAQHFVSLPDLGWADPFDRAHIAVALAKRMTLVTSDRSMLNLRITGLRTIDATK